MLAGRWHGAMLAVERRRAAHIADLLPVNGTFGTELRLVPPIGTNITDSHHNIALRHTRVKLPWRIR